MFKAFKQIRDHLRWKSSPEGKAWIAEAQASAQKMVDGQQQRMMQQAATGAPLDLGWLGQKVAGALGHVDMSHLVPEPSEFVKRTTCAACGGVKELPSVREFIYCDFCGQITDYDLKQAQSAAYTSPLIAEYGQISNRANPQAMALAAAGDIEGYRRLKSLVFEAQTAYTPWAVPPRAWNDEQYRRGWVTYQTEVAVLEAFDARHRELTSQMQSATMQMNWSGGNMLGMAAQAMTGRQVTEANRPKVSWASFEPFVQVLLAQFARTRELVWHSEVKSLDPDQTADVVLDRLGRSGLVQGWLPSLSPEDGERLIALVELDFSYKRPTVTPHVRTCASCGHEVPTVDGATMVVCNGCGRRVPVAEPQITCVGCNTAVSIPEGVTSTSCPSCKVQITRV